MDEKMLEQEYKKLKQQAAPDLWSRIEMNLAEHPEREAKAAVSYTHLDVYKRQVIPWEKQEGGQSSASYLSTMKRKRVIGCCPVI